MHVQVGDVTTDYAFGYLLAESICCILSDNVLQPVFVTPGFDKRSTSKGSQCNRQARQRYSTVIQPREFLFPYRFSDYRQPKEYGLLDGGQSRKLFVKQRSRFIGLMLRL